MSGNGIEKMVVGMTGEERHDMRLMALLHRMVREKRLKGAAETLGLDPRTVQTSMERGDLSELVRMALERHMLAEDDQQAARQRERTDALEQWMDTLEKELHDGIEAVKGEIGKLREDQDGKWESLEQRLARGETQQEKLPRPADAPNATGSTLEEATATDKTPPKARFPKRLYPELVTKEPAPDDEEVYGEAWPLIEEWREIWKAGHTGVGKGLAWLETEQRVRGLEVAMLEEYGLTLPPEEQPLHGLWRSTQLNWRKATVSEVRRAVAWRRLVRKVLTCGLWRSRWWPRRA